MRYCNEQLFRSQLEFLRHQFLQDGGLPFTDVLSRETVEQALDQIEVAWNERIYTPLATLWVFLGQVLSADHSCRHAVARFLAHRISRGESPCSSQTGAYCQARKRLPEQFFSTVARLVGRKLEDHSEDKWLWKGRRVYLFDRDTYRSMPEYLAVREARVRIEQPGFRTKVMIIVTTLLNPREYSKQDLANLYRERWNNELDLRSIKSVMQMECLRCKTPELVRKEIWTHALAYNLLRTIMAQAATKNALHPRSISFKGTLQVLEAFQPLIAMKGEYAPSVRRMFYEQLLHAVAQHQVANRPDRIEPRQIKRRHKHYVPLSVPRAEAKRQILQGLRKN